eukprot:TRINITY_DN3812_c0_g1_i1.p1 TRINITY_DN3812_c0_g1~~TRINITY_DN3812_c0_g1_i1.p1  ORF type:complete len:484 (-),score=148.24 TRINITY_DN3812_c0_g1_i1:120-1499(-)
MIKTFLLIFFINFCLILSSSSTEVNLLKDGPLLNCSSTTKIHTNDEINDFLFNINSLYPNFTKIELIGHSVNGQSIYAIHIGFYENAPRVKLVANINGKERSGRELLLCFIQELCVFHFNLVNNIIVTVIPTINPDGFSNNKQNNAHGVDLETNFPRASDDYENFENREPETLAIMNLSLNYSFVSSISFREGELVVSYPFDNFNDSSQITYSRSEDDEIFRDFSISYTSKNIKLFENKFHYYGIVNGALFNPKIGSMQDWNYWYHSTIEITAYISTKSNFSTPEIWTENRESLFRYLNRSLVCINITIDCKNENSRTFFSIGNDKTPIDTLEKGFAYKAALPGIWNVTADGDTCKSQTEEIYISPFYITNIYFSLESSLIENQILTITTLVITIVLVGFIWAYLIILKNIENKLLKSQIQEEKQPLLNHDNNHNHNHNHNHSHNEGTDDEENSNETKK